MSNLISHAKREFLKLGYKPVEVPGKFKKLWYKLTDFLGILKREGGDPNQWIQENILELIEVFSKQGHSGSSAPYCIEYFNKLASFLPIAPITGDEDEWVDTGGAFYQNNRCSAVFKEGEKGKPYYVCAITFVGEDPGDSFTGTVEDVKSSQAVKLPFTPKTFYIDVRREVYDEKKHGDDSRAVSCGDGDYVYFIKDRNQLLEVAEYYDMSEDEVVKG